MIFKSNEAIVRAMLEAIGEDPSREGLLETPSRVVKSWGELYGGYKQDYKTILGTTFSTEGYKVDEMVLCRDIEVYSTCEHHILPFYGRAHVAYIPKDRVVGLSKLARLVDCFSRRLQIQEKLTNQIADAILRVLDPRGVAVVIEARHHCMCARGVAKQNSEMVTSALRGAFKEKPEARQEFMQLIGKR